MATTAPTSRALLSVLRQRPPVRALQRVSGYVPGSRLSAITLPYSLHAFPLLRHRDAFLLEAMGQAGAVLVQNMERFRGRTAYFARIRNVEWHTHSGAAAAAGAGHQFAVHVSLARLHGHGFGTVLARAYPLEARHASHEPPRGDKGDECDATASATTAGELVFKMSE